MKTYNVEVYSDGDVVWYNEAGQRHREEGPAIEYLDGYREWHINGKRHRVDGPAVVLSDGTGYYYINGEEYTKEQFLERTIIGN